MYTVKDVTKDKYGDYHIAGRTFIVDQYGTIYERRDGANWGFCNKNGRTTKRAIVDAMNIYMMSTDNQED